MRLRAAALAAFALSLGVALGSPAQAADDELSIAHVEPAGDDVRILVSVPEGADVAPDDLAVTIGGEDAEVSAEAAGESVDQVRRTTIIALDTSNSMNAGGRFDAAKAAATTFLEAAPDDVYVGIVTFDRDVETALEPTQDRAAAVEVVAGLDTALRTRLNDGLLDAVELAGDEGQRNILVLSDGKDTSDTPASDVTDAIEAAGVRVDVVALDQTGDELAPLEVLSDAGNGSVITADPESLASAFDDEAASLSRQVLVTAQIPDGVTATETSVAVSAGTLSASSQVIIRDDAAPAPELASSDDEDEGGVTVSKNLMYVGLGALGVGLLVLLGGLIFTATAPKKAPSAEARIAAYGAGGTPPGGRGPDGKSDPGVTLDQAKEAAASMLQRNKGLEERIAARLTAAGSALKPAEWLLIHGGIAIGAGLVGALLGGGDIVFILIFLVLGALLPWLWLGRKRKKRLEAFNAGLADTLQLVAGSLSAGMSLAQAVDTVVKEGNEPISGEFNKALVDSRLGIPLVDALEDVAVRTESQDFAWVVMAIRIQRQVGGNLAELLTTVAATMREREYLRRQVRTLSAEGRLSGWILGLLPVGMFVYMLLARREYVEPLWTEFIGIVMLAAAAVLLALGAFLMSRIVKVEV